MGLNVGSLYSYSAPKSIIDTQALTEVTQRILNPNNENTVDVSKLDLSKFNRINLGTDLYAKRTSSEAALEISRSKVDFDVNLSKDFQANVQYLNSQAAQSLFTSKENGTKVVISIDSLQNVNEQQIIVASSQVSETQNMNKDKRGSNPFSFYAKVDKDEENTEDSDYKLNSLNIFA